MSILNVNKNFYVNSLIILSIFLLDRFTKLYVIYLYNTNGDSEIIKSKYLNIYLIWNEGIAFGLFSFDESNVYNFLTFFILIIIFIILYIVTKSNGLKKYALLMILGGAFGNVFDRIIYKAVPDFFDFHVGNFHWFIFNVADIFITIGVILMILIEFIGIKEKKDS